MTSMLGAASSSPISASIGHLASLKPYPGLRSFTQDEASLFFGREVQVRQIRDILANRNLLVVLGGSGSGKSSLVRAGLLPKLNSTAPIPRRSGAWYPIEFRPLTNPTEELFEAVFVQIFQPLLKTPSLSTGTEGPPTAIGLDGVRCLEAVSAALDIDPALQAGEDVQARCRTRLRERLFTGQTIDVGSIFEFAEQAIVILDEKLAAGPRSGKANLLILIDQFEEVFSLPNERREDGLSMVMSLVTSIQAFRPDNLFLIVTMRNEWLHRCSEVPGVAEAMNGSTYLVDLLTDSEIRNIIVEPARSVLRAANFDPGLPGRGPYALETLQLLQQAFDDTEAVPDASDRLPLLQHLLQLLWGSAAAKQDATEAPFSIETRHLEAVPGWSSGKGLPGCLNAHAGQVLDAAVEVARKSSPMLGKDGADKLIRTAFVNLAILDEKGIVRRNFATIDQMLDSSGLVERDPDKRAEIRKALAAALAEFKAAALVGSKNTASGELFDINHEALVRNWETCAGWINQAKYVKDRLRAIDEKIRSTFVEKAGILTRLNDLLFATDLRSAAEQVGSETAKALRDDVFGEHATFSTSWARDALGNGDVARIGDRVADAQRFADNPLHRYRPLAAFMAVLALAGLFTIITRQLVVSDMEQLVDLQSVTQPININFSQGTLAPAGPLEASAAFEIASEKLSSAFTINAMRKPLTDMLVNIEGSWRSHFARAIWFKSAQNQTAINRNGIVQGEPAICINPVPGARLQIGRNEKNKKSELAWAPIATGGQKTLWTPTAEADKTTNIISNLQAGEEWPEGSVICTSADGKWQLKWINDTAVPKWPSIRNILVNKLAPSQGEQGVYVDVGNERYFTDSQSINAYKSELQPSFSVLSAGAGTAKSAGSPSIQFVRDGHWVGFSIPVSTNKVVTLWTTEGIAEPQETEKPRTPRECVPIKGDLSAPNGGTGSNPRNSRCTIGPLKSGKDDLEVRVTSLHPGQDSPDCTSLASTCGTLIDILFIDSNNLADGSRNNKIRANINFAVKRKIKTGMITEDGYLVLTDIADHTWRYLIDGNQLAKLQKDTWREIDLEKTDWSIPCRSLRCKDVVERLKSR